MYICIYVYTHTHKSTIYLVYAQFIVYERILEGPKIIALNMGTSLYIPIMLRIGMNDDSFIGLHGTRMILGMED